MGPDGGENIRLDEEGNIALDRVIDDDGNPVKNYPLAPDPRDRRSEFENALMHAYMTKLAIERGEPLPPRKYQSEFDRKWCEWCDRNTDRYYRLRGWAETNLPKTLWVTDKIHDGMFWVGEKCSDALGLTQSRYQWVIDAAEWQAYQEHREREEEEEARLEEEAEREREEAETAAALEGGILESNMVGVAQQKPRTTAYAGVKTCGQAVDDRFCVEESGENSSLNIETHIETSTEQSNAGRKDSEPFKAEENSEGSNDEKSEAESIHSIPSPKTDLC